MTDKAVPAHLMQAVERDSKRFHIATIVFQALVLGALLVVLGFNIHQNSANHTLLKSQNAVVSQQKKAITQIEKNDDAKLTDLQSHIDCLFKLATTPHSTANPPLITNIQICHIVPSSSGGATGATKSS